MENIRRALQAFQQQKPIILIDAEGLAFLQVAINNRYFLDFCARSGDLLINLFLQIFKV